MNYLYKRTKSITRWAIKHWPLMTSSVTEKELLDDDLRNGELLVP